MRKFFYLLFFIALFFLLLHNAPVANSAVGFCSTSVRKRTDVYKCRSNICKKTASSMWWSCPSSFSSVTTPAKCKFLLIWSDSVTYCKVGGVFVNPGKYCVYTSSNSLWASQITTNNQSCWVNTCGNGICEDWANEKRSTCCVDCGGCGGPVSTPTPTPTPTPSCTVDLAPDPVTYSIGTAQTFTASVNPTPPGAIIDQVDFISGDTGIATVNPATDTTSVYSTEVTGVAQGSTSITSNVIMSGAQRCTDFSTVTIIDAGPWWQAKDADLMTSGNITSTIPSTCSGACTPNLILDGDGGYPGVAAYGGSLSVGSGNVSSTGWEANTALSIRKTYNYDYFAGLIPADVNINEITTATIEGTDLSSGGTATNGYYWYHYDAETYGDLIINSPVDLGDRKVILFVKDGNLNINARIFLNDGTGFFAAFVGENSSGGKGDIIVDGSVSHPEKPELEGMYLADNQFFTGTLGAGTDKQLHVRGSIAALGGMVLERDLDDNTDTPAEFFEFAPDQTLLFPKELRTKRFRWEEVAP